jgi:hypothetical protein
MVRKAFASTKGKRQSVGDNLNVRKSRTFSGELRARQRNPKKYTSAKTKKKYG